MKKQQPKQQPKQLSVKPKATKDSTDYFKRASNSFMEIANQENRKGFEAKANKLVKLAKSSFESEKRQKLKGKSGYDANGYPLKKK